MPSSSFQYGNYEYSIFGGKFYRSKIGESFSSKEISRNTYRKYFNQYYGKSASTVTRGQTLKLSERFKKLLWSKSDFGKSPWNNKGRRIQPHLKPLTINDKRTSFSRIRTDSGLTHGQWGANLSNGKFKGSAFVFNNIQEWIVHLRIAKHQLTVQAENFRIVVGQRALRVFQLSFKYHKFYNEDTAWKSLAPYTRKKRMVLGTWYGEQKSKLYEKGALAGSIHYQPGGKGAISRVLTDKANRERTRISVKDVMRGVPVQNRPTYSTDYIYAGIHNEGVPKGRKRGGKIPQRQFMGWSNLHSRQMDKIDTFAYEVADRYLFDSVFLSKKR